MHWFAYRILARRHIRFSVVSVEMCYAGALLDIDLDNLLIIIRSLSPRQSDICIRCRYTLTIDGLPHLRQSLRMIGRPSSGCILWVSCLLMCSRGLYSLFLMPCLEVYRIVPVDQFNCACTSVVLCYVHEL